MSKKSKKTESKIVKDDKEAEEQAIVKKEIKRTKSESLNSTEGLIVAKGTHNGIAGLQVFLHAEFSGDGPSIGTAITDKDGQFRIRHKGNVQSIEISTADATNSVVRPISPSKKDKFIYELSAEELSRLLPRRDATLKEREDRWEREATIRREFVHSRGLKVINKLLRQREFGSKIVNQLDMSTIPADIRENDLTFIDSSMSDEDKLKRFLDNCSKGISNATVIKRSIALNESKQKKLEELLKGNTSLPLNRVLDVSVGKTTPTIGDEIADVIKELRGRVVKFIRDKGAEEGLTDEDPDAEEASRDHIDTISRRGNETDIETDSTHADRESDGHESSSDEAKKRAAEFVQSAVDSLRERGNLSGYPKKVRSNQESLETEICDLNMRGGPADVTSYHEFRNVRIAFDPIWTEYFDPMIAEKVKEALGGLVAFEEDLPFEEITALEALKPYLTIAEELGADLDDDVDLIPPPKPVKDLVPELTPRIYTSLSETMMEMLEDLGARHEAVIASIDRGSLQPWEHFPPYDPAPSGWYYKDPGGEVNLPVGDQMPDFWYIIGLNSRIVYNFSTYKDREEVLGDTGFDICPGEADKPTIYTNKGDLRRYVKAEKQDAIEIDGRVYVWVRYAKDKAKKYFEAEARQILDPIFDLFSLDSKDEEKDGRVKSNLEALAKILTDMDEMKDYRFKLFLPGSVNFGVLLKYEQAWEPQNYQVGDLVRTIPLAPKESRRYKKRSVLKKSRNRKEIENALQTKSDSEENTGRAESEIIRRAQNATNFEATAEGKGGIGFVEFGGSATAKASAQEENAKNKRKMRQAVQKAANEYKQERRIEITTIDSEEMESSESGEIVNTNEEITVTYLFYELQKRFLVNERLADVEPIILIAHDVPSPSEISESWIIRHDWILKRVLLDDSFIPTFKLLEESNKARDVMIAILRDDLQRKVKAFNEIKEQVATNLRVKDMATDALKEAIKLRIEALQGQTTTTEQAGDVALTIFTHGLFGSQGLLGMGGTAAREFENSEAAEQRQESSEEMLARADEEARRLRSLLEGAEVALERATQKYSDAVRGRLNKELAVLRLRNHIAQNILHYMQAIWEYEPPDQRFFRLYEIQVPTIGGKVGVDVGENEVTITFSPDGIDMSDPGFMKLADVADLDKLIGYKGNYLMFPLRQHNYLTAWMVQEYLDDHGDVRDPGADQMPDPGEKLSTVNSELMTLNMMEYEIMQEITKEYAAVEVNEARVAVLESANRTIRHQINLEQSKIAQVVIPTDLLFIEALPGKHPLLEDFKLEHRSLDVEKVTAERDILELEKIRRTALLLSGKYYDPDVDKLIDVRGTPMSINTDV